MSWGRVPLFLPWPAAWRVPDPFTLKGKEMVKKVKRVLSVRFLPQAMCKECDWGHSMSSEARSAGKQHVDDCGHSVIVETIARDVYQLEEQ